MTPRLPTIAHAVAGAAACLAGSLHGASVAWKVSQGKLVARSSPPTLYAVGAVLVAVGVALLATGLPPLRRDDRRRAIIGGCGLASLIVAIAIAFAELRGLPLIAFPLIDLVVLLRARRA